MGKVYGGVDGIEVGALVGRINKLEAIRGFQESI